MLKSWSIKNFKPIVDSGELQLAPVTILAGRNSSGKSSLLQSILMISQTLGSRLLDRPLLLNERFVQLGTFENVLSEKASSESINIGLELWFEEGTYSWTTAYSVMANVSFVSSNSSTDRSASATSTILIGQIQLDVIFNAYQLAFNFEDPDNPRKENLKIDFQAKFLKHDEKQEFLKNVKESFYDILTDTSNYSGHLNYSQSTFAEDSYLVGFAHFLPERFIKKFNIVEQRQIDIEQDLSELFQLSRRSNFRTSDPFEISLADISDDLFEEIAEFCQQMDISTVFTGETLGDLASWYKSIQWVSESERIAFGQELQGIVIPHLLSDIYKDDDITEYSEGLAETTPLSLFERINEQITHFFANFIRYLGPLRSDPGTVQQQFAPTGELDNVGTKGEYAAMVYHANKNTRIDWYNPQTRQIENAVLSLGLDTWAQYLKIAEHISTEEAGAIGITWQIIPGEGRKPRLLPEVGVGISQILPILVMGLLSPANSLLIIEQPELHLHPFVQARLGDFFMGLAKCKKQCIIETHSENLVSQLRLHIVQAGGLEKSDCMIYFVDQDEKGAAKFEKIDISPNGNILNWPEGFFDEAMLQEDRITAASLRKRAREAKHGS